MRCLYPPFSVPTLPHGTWGLWCSFGTGHVLRQTPWCALLDGALAAATHGEMVSAVPFSFGRARFQPEPSGIHHPVDIETPSVGCIKASQGSSGVTRQEPKLSANPRERENGEILTSRAPYRAGPSPFKGNPYGRIPRGYKCRHHYHHRLHLIFLSRCGRLNLNGGLPYIR